MIDLKKLSVDSIVEVLSINDDDDLLNGVLSLSEDVILKIIGILYEKNNVKLVLKILNIYTIDDSALVKTLFPSGWSMRVIINKEKIIKLIGLINKERIHRDDLLELLNLSSAPALVAVNGIGLFLDNYLLIIDPSSIERMLPKNLNHLDLSISMNTEWIVILDMINKKVYLNHEWKIFTFAMGMATFQRAVYFVKMQVMERIPSIIQDLLGDSISRGYTISRQILDSITYEDLKRDESSDQLIEWKLIEIICSNKNDDVFRKTIKGICDRYFCGAEFSDDLDRLNDSIIAELQFEFLTENKGKLSKRILSEMALIINECIGSKPQHDFDIDNRHSKKISGKYVDSMKNGIEMYIDLKLSGIKTIDKLIDKFKS